MNVLNQRIGTNYALYQTEEWRPILDGAYEVSNLGCVRRALPGKKTYAGYVLKPQSTRTGYLFVAPVIDGKNKNCYIHALVAEAFIGPRPEGYDINHIDGDKSNNTSSNLEYVTRLQNVRHAIAMGLAPQCVPKVRPPKIPKIHDQRGEKHWTRKRPERILRGEQRYNHKVTALQVEQIRARVASGERQCDLCIEYGLSRAQISRIVNRKEWAS